MLRKIVILGPESTGKSTLCHQLAEHYQTVWCPEFAREYLMHLKRAYTFDDLFTIATAQVELEDQLLSQARNNLYFIDTDMYVMKVWCEVAFNDCHTWILKQIANRKYDMHFLLDVDLPWTDDGLREYPDVHFRKRLFKMYFELMVSNTDKWAVISGSYAERLQTAISIINTLYPKP